MDDGSIRRRLASLFAADVVRADTSEEALAQLKQGNFSLVLVNRIFDLNGEEGLELIRKIKSDNALGATPVLLVSNYAEAQAEAAKLGAQPGFGKASLTSEETAALLRTYLS
jgi:CheY-like chemotaxis protein